MRRLSLRFTRAGFVSLAAVLLFAFCVFNTAMQEPKALQQVFIIALMLCTFGALLFAFARFATALVVCSALFAAIKFLSVLKIKYLEESLMPSDFIYYAGTSLLDTLRHYPHLYLLSIAICVIVPPLLWLVWAGTGGCSSVAGRSPNSACVRVVSESACWPSGLHVAERAICPSA